MGDWQGALADYDRAIDWNPTSAELYHERGGIRHARCDFAGALPDYDQALSLNSRFCVAYVSRAGRGTTGATWPVPPPIT